MTLDRIELHDGRLKNMKIDFVARTVAIKIDLFESPTWTIHILLISHDVS